MPMRPVRPPVAARFLRMPPFRVAALVASIASVACAGVASADSPWPEPVTVLAPTDVFRVPGLAFTDDGHALATLSGGRNGRDTILAAAPGSTRFTQTGRRALAAPPALFARRSVAYLQRSATGASRARLSVAFGTVGGATGAPRELARPAVLADDLTARIATDPRGNVAAAWLEPRHGRLLVRVALRPAGRPFGRATTIGVATAFGDRTPLEMAYAANGDLAVAFQRSRTKQVDHRSLELVVGVRRRGRSFFRSQAVGPVLGASSVVVAGAPTGRIIVAWGTQDSGEGVEDPWTVRATVLEPKARRFGRAQVIDSGAAGRAIAPVTAAVAADGSATVAWSGVAARTPHYPVRVASATPSGRFGRAARLARNGAARGVVTSRDGTTTVLWCPLSDPEAETVDRILASRRGPAATLFAAPEGVSLEREVATNTAALALDARSGRTAVLWIGAPGTPAGELLANDARVELRYAVRQ